MKAVMTEKKKQNVSQLTDLIKEYPIVGIVNMESLPAKNLGGMRKQLRGKVQIVMSKKRLIRLAFAKSKKQGIEKLEHHLQGMPALILTKENPFTLFKTLKKNQSAAPIKAGQVAPEDLIITAGPTPFPPGPIIGELGQLGIKGGVEGGKVVIKQDATLAKEGEVVNEKVAGFLARMGVEPMRIGLKLVAVLEDGDVLTKDVLDVDEEAMLAQLQIAASSARNLAMEVAFPTKDTINTLIQKAHYDAAGLALEQEILTDVNARALLARAYWQAVGVAKYLPEDQRPDVPQAEAPAEEKKDSNDKQKPKEETADTAAGLGALFG